MSKFYKQHWPRLLLFIIALSVYGTIHDSLWRILPSLVVIWLYVEALQARTFERTIHLKDGGVIRTNGYSAEEVDEILRNSNKEAK